MKIIKKIIIFICLFSQTLIFTCNSDTETDPFATWAPPSESSSTRYSKDQELQREPSEKIFKAANLNFYRGTVLRPFGRRRLQPPPTQSKKKRLIMPSDLPRGYCVEFRTVKICKKNPKTNGKIHLGNYFKCITCDAFFPNNEQAKKHTMESTNTTPYQFKSSEQDYTFTRVSLWEEVDDKLYYKGKYYNCSFCQEFYPFKPMKHTHPIAMVPSNIQSMPKNPQPQTYEVNKQKVKQSSNRITQTYNCKHPHCSFYSLSSQKLGIHIKTEHINKISNYKYICPECGRTYQKLDAIEKHMVTNHGYNLQPIE